MTGDPDHTPHPQNPDNDPPNPLGLPMPAELPGIEDYAWITTPDRWAISESIGQDGAASLVLGFLVADRWGGIRLPLDCAAEITTNLAAWLTAYANANAPDAPRP